ncbi:MAG: histidinol-phosphate transaminase [Calditrichaeota bacterium]|nr:histidinol-phosphate transaminase [Calditrichota bacterium]
MSEPTSTKLTPPRRRVMETIQPYEPGRPISEIQREYGLEHVIKLASNENPLGPSPLAVEAIKRELSQIHRYPDPSGFAVRQKLAARFGVDMSSVMLGNGSVEIIDLLCVAFLDPGNEMITAERSFPKYVIATRWMGGIPVLAPMERWTFDLEAILAHITERTRLIFIANPNNPTGTRVSNEEIHRFMDKLPPHVVVVFDEAYFDYLEPDERPDTIRYVHEGRNVVILHTFSKAYGLAGLRIGYALAPAHLVHDLNMVREVFNMNHLAQVAALAALDDEEFLQRSRVLNQLSKSMFLEQLGRLGLDYVPTCTNFVMIHFDRPALRIFQALLRQGVIVRPLRGYHLPNSMRVTFGLLEENEIFFKELETVLAQPVPASESFLD